MANTISNTDDVIDSRDVIERIEELQGEIRGELEQEFEDEQDFKETQHIEMNNAARSVWEKEQDEAEDRLPGYVRVDYQQEDYDREEFDEPDLADSTTVRELKHHYSEELANLLDLQDEAEDYCSDWKYGVTLIHEDYFETYAEELASEIGAINRDAQWPLNHINWEDAAEELKTDYNSVEFDGQTYYVR